MATDIADLNRKYRKVAFLLGELVHKLHRNETARFLCTTDGIEDEKEMHRLLNLLDYLDERIENLGDVDDADDQEGGETEEAEDASSALAAEAGECVGPSKEPVLENSDIDAGKDAAELPDEAAEPVKEDYEQENAPVEAEKIPEEAAEAVGPAIEEARETPAADPVTTAQTASDDSLSGAHGLKFGSDAEKDLFEENLAGFRDGNERERERCVRAIAHLSSREAIRQVCKAAIKDDSPEVRVAAVRSLAKTIDSGNEDIFKLALKDADNKVKTAAIKAISVLAKEEHIKLLEPLLSDGDPHIRGMVGTCLGIYYGKKGLEMAGELRHDESPYVRKSIVEMLGVVNPRESFGIINEMTGDSESEVKEAARTSLSKCVKKKKETAHEKRKRK